MRRAFTIVELLAVVGILLILAGLLFPVIGSAKRSAQARVCAANLAQASHAINLYAIDADGIFPAAKDCPDLLIPGSQSPRVAGFPMLVDAVFPYSKSRAIFRCPQDTGAAVYERLFPSALALAPSAFAACGMSYEYRTELGLEAISDTRLEHPAEVNVLVDLAGYWHGSTRALTARDNFDGYSENVPGYRYNVAYADGHVRIVAHDELEGAWRRG